MNKQDRKLIAEYNRLIRMARRPLDVQPMSDDELRFAYHNASARKHTYGAQKTLGLLGHIEWQSERIAELERLLTIAVDKNYRGHRYPCPACLEDGTVMPTKRLDELEAACDCWVGEARAALEAGE